MEKETLFNIINSYPWEKIKAQVGYCINIPRGLSRIIDNDEQIRESGYNHFDSQIVVQGGLYEGAFYVIPFILQLLKLPEFFYADKIYEVLYELGNGASEYEEISYTEINSGFLYFVPSVNESSTNNKIILLAIGCRNTVLSGFPIYLEEVKTNKHKARKQAIELLCTFNEHQYLVTSSLRDLYMTQQDKDLETMIESIILDYFG